MGGNWTRSKKTVRAGVIGVGHMGQYHAGVYASLFNAELVGVVDVDEERAERIAFQYQTEAFTDYRDLFGRVDVVSVAVPTNLHYDLTRDCIEHGIHVLVEKPITKNLDQARELFHLAEENAVVLHIGHVERFNGAVQELAKVVVDPIFIEARRLGPFQTRTTDDGVVLDLMIHDLDIVLKLVKSPVKSLHAEGVSLRSDREDLANVQIRFENECLASLTASRLTEHKIRTMAVTQTDAYVFLDFTDQDIHIHRRASSEHLLTQTELRYKQEAFIEQIFVHKDNPLKLEIAHLIDCASNGAPRAVSVEEELYSMEVAVEILRQISATLGAPLLF